MDKMVIKSGPFGTIPYYLLEWAPSVNHIDAALTYDFVAFNQKMTLSVKGQNLANRFDIAAQSFAVSDSPPRTVEAAIKFRF